MSRLSAFARTLLIAVSIAAVAVLIPAAVVLVGGKAQPVLVVFALRPDPALLSGAMAIMEWDGNIARISGADAADVRNLYRQGAVLVLPIRSSGCMALRKKGEPDGQGPSGS